MKGDQCCFDDVTAVQKEKIRHPFSPTIGRARTMRHLRQSLPALSVLRIGFLAGNIRHKQHQLQFILIDLICTHCCLHLEQQV